MELKIDLGQKQSGLTEQVIYYLKLTFVSFAALSANFPAPAAAN